MNEQTWTRLFKERDALLNEVRLDSDDDRHHHIQSVTWALYNELRHITHFKLLSEDTGIWVMWPFQAKTRLTSRRGYIQLKQQLETYQKKLSFFLESMFL